MNQESQHNENDEWGFSPKLNNTKVALDGYINGACPNCTRGNLELYTDQISNTDPNPNLFEFVDRAVGVKCESCHIQWIFSEPKAEYYNEDNDSNPMLESTLDRIDREIQENKVRKQESNSFGGFPYNQTSPFAELIEKYNIPKADPVDFFPNTDLSHDS